MKKKTKDNICFYLSMTVVFWLIASVLWVITDFGKNEFEFYKIYDKNFSEYFDDAKKRWFLSEKEYQEQKKEVVTKKLKELELLIQKDAGFIEDICYVLLQNKGVEKEIAQNVCPCVGNKVPMKHIYYIMDNLEKMDFLVYKGVPEAVEANTSLFDQIKECSIEYRDNLSKK